MGCINKSVISGNLTHDPELRQTKGGTSVLSMAVAVNARRKNGDQWEDYPSYVDVTVWGARAEALAKFLHRGMRVAVSGRLEQDRWQDANGNNRSRLGIVADEVDVMTPRDGSQGGQTAVRPQARQAPAPYSAPAPTQEALPDVYDEDIPF